MTTALFLAAVVIGLPGLAVAVHLGILTLASLFYRERDARADGKLRLLVIIPAHNEERVIGRCLEAIEADRRPRDLVMVVADRCTDGTVQIARSFKASVVERSEEEAPGRAQARQAGLQRARSLEWDAVVMLDADSIIESGFFDACERALAAGAPAVQARSESSKGRRLATELSLVAFSLQGITIPRGRDRLGLSVRLRGTGMAIRRDLALRHRFTAPASEDLYFTLDLLLEGIRCRHVESARLRSDAAGSWSSFGGQKVRYEAGRMSAARAYAPQLARRAARHRDVASLEAAWFLLTPPFALGALSLVVAAVLAAFAQAWPAVVLFGAGLMVLTLAVVTGLVQARAGLRTWLALLAAPWYIGWKTVVQLRALASVARRRTYYPPTARV
jgi:cellulose synthase/poly-beta-1,6-N-acetylglucosamine synthase-like glycosyltransferase